MTRRSAVVVAVVAALMIRAYPAGAQAVFDVEFRDAPLGAVLQALARAARVNLVVEGTIPDRVTLHLRQVTFRQALELLSAVYRLTYTVQGGVYIVRKLRPGSAITFPAGFQEAPLQLRAYRLKHARAEEVAQVLGRAVPALTAQQAGQGVQGPQQAAPSPQQGQQGGSQQPQQQPARPSPQAPQAGGPQDAPRQTASPPATQADLQGEQRGGQAAMVVVADPASNSVLVAAPVAVQLQVQAALRVLDVPRAASGEPQQPRAQEASPEQVIEGEQVGPDTVAYRVRYADLDQLQRILRSEIPDIRINADPRTRRLIVTGPAKSRETAARLVRLLDRPVPQVMMSTRVVELTENASRRLGIRWDWTPTVVVSGGSVSINADALGTIIALVEEGQGRVLANPTVATSDGRKATINAGTQLFIPITTTVGGTTTTTLHQINAGIKLEVTPRIVDEKNLVAELGIEVNSLAGFGPQGTPIINSRSVSTILQVQDGSQIVIGGLISETTTELLRKIPLLGDIPVLGELFRYREHTRNYSNIVVIIIPRIMMPEDQEQK